MISASAVQAPSARSLRGTRRPGAGVTHGPRRAYGHARMIQASASAEDSMVQTAVAADVGTCSLPALKAKLLTLAGSKNGVDLSAEGSKAVMEHLKQFEGLGRSDPEQMPLAGTKWKVVFTDTEGAANGKLGPFVGKCTLDFPSDTEYVANIDHFGGALSIDLVSDYAPGDKQRINLKLLRNDFRLFGFQTGMVELNLKGYHTVKFADEDVRVFVTNQGNTFATVRVTEQEQ